MTGPPPSGIRKFYGKIESVGERNEKYLCGLCSSVVSSSAAATSNLIKHMRRHHPNEFENYLREHRKNDNQSNTQPRPGVSGYLDKRIRLTEETNDSNIRRLIRFLAGGLLSSSVVDDASFIQFVQGLQPRFTVPSSHQLNMVILPRAYEELRAKLRETLSHVSGVCLSIDVLKDHYENYLFIILVSYITVDWKKGSDLLTCRMFKTLPSKSCILGVYDAVVSEMNLSEKIQSIVIGKLRQKTMSATSFTGWDSSTAYNRNERELFIPSEIFDSLWEEIPTSQKCFNDVFQDVIVKGIEETASFQEQIVKISSLVYSINVLLTGDEMGKAINQTAHWAEQVRFMKKCLRCSSEVFQCAVSSLTYEDQKNFLGPNDRAILMEIAEIFEAFEDASERIQSTSGIASSQVLPIIRGLRHHLRSINPFHCRSIVSTLSLALEQKFAVFESNEVLQQASMVDPRFKTAWCSSEEQPVLQSKLQLNVVKLSVKEPNDDPFWTCKMEDTPKRPKLFSYMTSERPSPKPWMSSDINECAREEVSRFLASPCRKHDVSPLDFWRGMETEFPLISNVARKCLCTEVSTRSVKEIFGQDLSLLSRGTHLTEGEFEKLAFLKSNLEKI